MAQVNLANAVNYSDINRLSEGSAMHLLNLVCGYALKDLNREQKIFSGLDLGDHGPAGLGVQVTSRTDSAKLLEALQIFAGAGYRGSFPNGIRFFIVSDRKRQRILPERLQTYLDIFDPQQDIWLLTDLMADIQQLYYDHPERLPPAPIRLPLL